MIDVVSCAVITAREFLDDFSRESQYAYATSAR